MTSVYYHGYPGAIDPNDFDPPLEFQPLEEAAAVLAADTTEAGAYRRREAIAKIAVGNFAAGMISPEYADALDTLGASIDDLAEALDNASFQSREEAEQAVYQFLAQSHLGSDCAESTTNVGYDPLTQSTLVAVTVTGLDRPLADVAIILDPQNWAHCSIWFEASYVAKEVGGTYPIDANGDAEEAPSPPAQGDSWSDVLFEHFTFGPIGQTGWWLKNLFNIDSVSLSDGYLYTYDLYLSIRSKVLLPAQPGGMVRNQGYINAQEQASGKITITGAKLVKFGGYLAWYNPSAPFFLRPMGESTKSIACTCEPPEEPPSLIEIICEWFESWF